MKSSTVYCGCTGLFFGAPWSKNLEEPIFGYLSIIAPKNFIANKDVVVYEMMNLLRNGFEFILTKSKVLILHLIYSYIESNSALDKQLFHKHLSQSVRLTAQDCTCTCLGNLKPNSYIATNDKY